MLVNDVRPYSSLAVAICCGGAAMIYPLIWKTLYNPPVNREALFATGKDSPPSTWPNRKRSHGKI
jgi:hypothetical protein